VSRPPNPEQFVGASVPTPPIADDDGSTSPELLTALAELAEGTGDAVAVLAALADSRVLVPVVAVLDESETGSTGLRQEKHSSMATVLIETGDGRRALLAFSGTEPMGSWRPDARPVSMLAPLAARAAVTESADTLVVDVAGPTPFAVTGGELLMLAAVARPAGDPTHDPVVRAAVRSQLHACGWVESAALVSPGEIGEGPASLLVAGRATDDELMAAVRRLAGDRVLTRLLPAGLRVKNVASQVVADTPGRCYP
jgi:hypothetical protein